MITGPFTTMEDLKSIIIGSFYSDFEDFTSEDLDNIYNQKDKIDAM